ncbi:inositol monophosphatase family protein [Desulfobacter vibrioformis]|uniref:inositol monophosphatase family protein n=1 Tax=Desulfobacter vibrioformis TaxID=34031 RepID=UPI0005589F22|nr:inositol monophosphatase family protein [Desulfobacter vibrioformis]
MISFIKNLALDAGRICLDGQKQLTIHDLEFKSAKDIVTSIDKEVEAFLVKALLDRYPDHGILGEEYGAVQTKSGFRWIIDPIDGTTSFVHQLPFYSISIALEKEGEMVLGVVYAPALGQLFYAEKGKGAFMDGTPIHVSGTRELDKAVMATGFACLRAGWQNNNLPIFNEIVPQLRDIRRFGSAALDLCYTALGSLDGFWEMNLNIYDIAAGIVILKEAGGVVTDFTGAQQFPQKGIAAANKRLHNELIRILAKYSASSKL